MKLTAQEILFLRRVAEKIREGETSIHDAMRAVLADDQRIFENYLTADDRVRKFLLDALAEGIYEAIRGQS